MRRSEPAAAQSRSGAARPKSEFGVLGLGEHSKLSLSSAAFDAAAGAGAGSGADAAPTTHAAYENPVTLRIRANSLVKRSNSIGIGCKKTLAAAAASRTGGLAMHYTSRVGHQSPNAAPGSPLIRTPEPQSLSRSDSRSTADERESGGSSLSSSLRGRSGTQYSSTSAAKSIRFKRSMRSLPFVFKSINVYCGEISDRYTVQHLVDHVDISSVAYEEGLREGDLITHVNGVSVEGLLHTQLVGHLYKAGPELTLSAIPIDSSGIQRGGRKRQSLVSRLVQPHARHRVERERSVAVMRTGAASVAHSPSLSRTFALYNKARVPHHSGPSGASGGSERELRKKALTQQSSLLRRTTATQQPHKSISRPSSKLASATGMSPSSSFRASTRLEPASPTPALSSEAVQAHQPIAVTRSSTSSSTGCGSGVHSPTSFSPVLLSRSQTAAFEAASGAQTLAYTHTQTTKSVSARLPTSSSTAFASGAPSGSYADLSISNSASHSPSNSSPSSPVVRPAGAHVTGTTSPLAGVLSSRVTSSALPNYQPHSTRQSGAPGSPSISSSVSMCATGAAVGCSNCKQYPPLAHSVTMTSTGASGLVASLAPGSSLRSRRPSPIALSTSSSSTASPLAVSTTLSTSSSPSTQHQQHTLTASLSPVSSSSVTLTPPSAPLVRRRSLQSPGAAAAQLQPLNVNATLSEVQSPTAITNPRLSPRSTASGLLTLASPTEPDDLEESTSL